MQHLPSILWLLSWPLVIYISYRVAVLVLKQVEKGLPEEERTPNL